MTHVNTPLVSAVIIGRNEGQRLVECLRSVNGVRQDGFRLETIYVDSDSTDDSPGRARTLGARVIEVRPERPCAAVGRNAGWRAARGEYVLFLDGDTILQPDFIRQALKAISAPEIAVVWGHRREQAPEQSLYVRVLDLDWVYPPGESEFCGGDALMRHVVLEQVGGFDDTLIAGEEPELCRRMRALGHKILHIDTPMTTHDLAVTSFDAYWRRAFRAGHAYAEVAARFRHSNDPLWLADSRRNLLRGTALLCAPLVMVWSMAWPWLTAVLLSGGVALLARTAHRCAWKTPNPATRLLYAAHSHLQQVPILLGQLAWRIDVWRGRRRGLIEYKGAPTADIVAGRMATQAKAGPDNPFG
jgi:glycosyltransferase involved in cell wall biosynthesis